MTEVAVNLPVLPDRDHRRLVGVVGLLESDVVAMVEALP